MERVYDLYDSKGKKLESILESRDCVFDIFNRLIGDEKTYMVVNGSAGAGKTYFLNWFVSYLKANQNVNVVVLSERLNRDKDFARSDCLFFDCLFAFMFGMFSNYVVVADSFPDYVFKMCEHGFTIVPLCWLSGFVFTTLSLLFGKN